ncbi:RDD family protein [Oxynema aestuarii]|uniref:RDD family protein n=1 Tax=Oxynema aestuarii AP17 TaxID=2064643 RepID=A0A6H1TVU5_9CYAN|nr:RDD family protein [Oxynema aestuarii]QIZ70691.1 RDD family protein [Oxynema aestuarii AP17]
MTSRRSQSFLDNLLRRILAGLIDYLLLISICWFGLGLQFNIGLTGLFADSQVVTINEPRNLFVIYLILVAYFSLGESFLGLTLGKFIFQAEVVTVRGHRPSLVQAALRNLFKPFDLLLLLSPILLSPKYQTLGDRFAKTLVIKRNAAVPTIPSNKYSLSPQKIVGWILLAVAIVNLTIWFYFASNYFPETKATARATNTYFMRLEKGFEIDNLESAYTTSSSRLQAEETLESFQQRLLGNPGLQFLLENRKDINFYRWEFKEDMAMLFGEIDKEFKITVVLDRENQQWKFLSGSVEPIENPQDLWNKPNEIPAGEQESVD